MEHINNYIDKHKDRFINELIELLKIPSISADPNYKQNVLNCADAVAKSIENAGADNIEICETPGYPIVYAEKIIDPSLIGGVEKSLLDHYAQTQADAFTSKEGAAADNERNFAVAAANPNNNSIPFFYASDLMVF